jgi:hypothetical protein
MNSKKAFERPETGPFYLIPDPKTGKYTIFSSFETPGKDEVHIFLWTSVVEILRRRFKGVEVDTIADTYRGLPRGRVMGGEGNWIIGYGKDFPLDSYRYDIESEFNLGDAVSINKVKWEFSEHETMTRNDKAEVEATLGIVMTPAGFSKKKK